MQSTGVGQTDLGRARSSNEDADAVDDELGLYIVAVRIDVDPERSETAQRAAAELDLV